ncbi:golgi-body localization protein domain-containing protein [Hygrophoropsis aurantiaca]|uniref:Golgi-body localization protein domain-containing protein n=1 Tax=Hygrophoropsis aurantiaca TaxID=72124 RepID=A0ACB8AMI5_9AGAM|nr:golgi-body localization protein domain-containing protein [Hygrophoropsis aurantiaca]
MALNSLWRIMEALILRASTTSFWVFMGIWILSLVMFLMVIRAYLGPYILMRFSNHIRIRSISLRSIRGLYFRRGNRTWTADRVGVSFSSPGDGKPKRLAFSIEDLKLEIDDREPLAPQRPRHTRHKRRLTLADLSPSPLALYLWSITSTVYSIFDPCIRPVIRFCVAACLGQIIRYIPTLTQALQFELDSATVSFTSSPQTHLTVEHASLQAHLSFTKSPKLALPAEQEGAPLRHALSPRALAMGAWKPRLGKSFKRTWSRTWDRTWGQTMGAASFTFNINKVAGFVSSAGTSASESCEPFFSLPGTVVLNGSARFTPKDGTLNPGSLYTGLSVSAISVDIDGMKTFLHLWNAHRHRIAENNESPLAIPMSPKSPSYFGMYGSLPTRSGSVVRYALPRKKKSTAWISFLGTFKVDLSALTFSTKVPRGSYKATLHNLSCKGGLSTPESTAFHHEYVGRKGKTILDESLMDAYFSTLSISKASLQRIGITPNSSLNLISIASIKLDVLVSQWPSPWIEHRSSHFMPGDPNAPLLAVGMEVASITLTEHFDILEQMFSHTPQSQPSTTPVLPKFLNHLPRLAVSLDIGSFHGCIICADFDGYDEQFSLEIDTEGLLLTASSSFTTRAITGARLHSEDVELMRLPIHMDLDLQGILRPVFVRLCANCSVTKSRRFSRIPSDSENGDPVVSVEAIEIKANVTASGQCSDDEESIVSLDTESIMLKLHCFSDAVLVELWHPQIIGALATLLSNFNKSESVSRSSRFQGRLPIGVAVSFSIGRTVLFLTAADINPNGDDDITRGIALGTGISMHYCLCYLSRPNPLDNPGARRRNRVKLGLYRDRITEVIESTKAHSGLSHPDIYGKLLLWKTTIRSAAADLFSMDDPYVIEGTDSTLLPQVFLDLQKADIDIRMSNSPDAEFRGRTSSKSCHIGVNIPDVQIQFALSHAYSCLLAARTAQKLLRAIKSNSDTREDPSLQVQLDCTVGAIQIHLDILQHRLVTQINHSKFIFCPLKHEVAWNTLLIWVPVPRQFSSRNCGNEERWEELGCLHRVTIKLPQLPTDPISVEGDSARVHIPSGYVLADLILAAAVTLKSLRHLVHTVAAGSLLPVPSPDAECAKVVPRIAFTFRYICFQAADDPFEAKLGLILRTGLDAAKERLRREEAFKAKMAVILATETSGYIGIEALRETSDYQFHHGHSITIAEARQRLDRIHALDWAMRIHQKGEERAAEEEIMHQRMRGFFTFKRPMKTPNIIKVSRINRVPPLFRVILHGLSLQILPPSFPIQQLPTFLHDQGQGIPTNTTYSLLIPMHLKLSLTTVHATLRDYPLPLIHIPGMVDGELGEGSSVLTFGSDVVIAEEMGPPQSVEWIPCCIDGLQRGHYVTRPFTINIPKTIMPVKTYANPDIRVLTNGVTGFAWGISYSPAIQDLVRVIETLTSEPRDSSPSIGFWDKLRLVLHWKIRVSFADEVRLYMKGTRDPYTLQNDGAGFALCWKGHPRILIGFNNDNEELMQVLSDTMSIIIPQFECKDHDGSLLSEPMTHAHIPSQSRCLKTCAKLSSGVCFGVGVALERSCGPECLNCLGTPFDRACRFFSFRPHHDVKLVKKAVVPQINSIEDSYNGYRSDFIHLSISLTSGLEQTCPPTPSSFHLTPKAFANFWSWWGLFDNNLSLPIRQGSYYPAKPMSPKFARHLATIKYRLSVPRLLVSHVYIDESRDSWVQGITPFVGVKAMIDHFHADLHQRDQESIEPGRTPDSIKIVRHKPFYAAEVIMKNLDLRAMLATFSEPLKQAVPVSPPDNTGNYRTRLGLAPSDVPSPWLDLDDFIETDWSSSSVPNIHLVPALSCPQLTYFKKNVKSSANQAETSKFGTEETHACLLGQGASVCQVEIGLALKRVAELRSMMARSSFINKDAQEQRRYPLNKMATLLEDYIAHLHAVDMPSEDSRHHDNSNYYMPSDTVSAHEWADFENVYQVHAPKVFMSVAIRDIMMQYYNCSRARRGFEYHMATRAVRFIRDQADAITALDQLNMDNHKGPVNAAQAAATALRKIFSGDSKNLVVDVNDSATDNGEIDPLNGWEDGISLRKSHFCLLLKPQIVLRSDSSSEAVSVLAAVQAKLQSFKIMDDSHIEDPISGTIMTRNYMSLDGLQTFCPTERNYKGDGCVPLEVLIDYRCESHEFDRIVPQTNATFHYDRFNRLRLRNNVTSATRSVPDDTGKGKHSHLHNDTDLIHVHVPQFTVSASDGHFGAISNIVTNLILFSDVAHKNRLEKLETLLFTYDFTDLFSAANVVSDLQGRLRSAIEILVEAENHPHVVTTQTAQDILTLKAHISLLAEELSLIFDAIKLAQNGTDDGTDQKSALLLHASSSDISWRMLDDQRDLLAKLAVRNIDYSWLSKQDSSTVNKLTVGDLRVYDGSPHAVWAEIVSKYEEPTNHPLFKRDVFLVAEWTVLAPVGGIAIYEEFILNFHPIRLQLDAALGQRIMEYVWPDRRGRNSTNQERSLETSSSTSHPSSRSSLDSAQLLRKPRNSLDSKGLAPPLRSLGSSRSFTDLRSAAAESLRISSVSSTQTYQSTPDPMVEQKRTRSLHSAAGDRRDDAAEMKTRSSQKNFILVKIPSLHLLLSIMKAESFECKDARIRTRDLEYRNQTWSFEELADQFIPSDMTWKGWVKMALHQPLVPVLPVARELISKTKWIASKSSTQLEPRATSSKTLRLKSKKESSRTLMQSQRSRTSSPQRRLVSGSAYAPSDAESPEFSVTGTILTDEPESLDQSSVGSDDRRRSGESAMVHTRTRLLSVFGRGRKGTEPRLQKLKAEPGRRSTDDMSAGSSLQLGSTIRTSDGG